MRLHTLAALAAALVTSSGCLVLPHSVLVGQTAMSPGKGATEVGVGAGVGVSSVSTSTSTSSTTSFAVPLVEGNVQYGLGAALTINLHGGASGLAPGLKITLLRGGLELALLPSIGFGVVTESQRSARTTVYDVLGSLRLLLSHGGFYGAVGYQILYLGSTSHDSEVDSSDGTTAHTLLASVGYRFETNPMRVYVEAGGYYSPSISDTTMMMGMLNFTSTQTSTDWGFILSLTLAVIGGGHAPVAAH